MSYDFTRRGLGTDDNDSNSIRSSGSFGRNARDNDSNNSSRGLLNNELRTDYAPPLRSESTREPRGQPPEPALKLGEGADSLRPEFTRGKEREKESHGPLDRVVDKVKSLTTSNDAPITRTFPFENVNTNTNILDIRYSTSEHVGFTAKEVTSEDTKTQQKIDQALSQFRAAGAVHVKFIVKQGSQVIEPGVAAAYCFHTMRRADVKFEYDIDIELKFPLLISTPSMRRTADAVKWKLQECVKWECKQKQLSPVGA